MDKNKNKATSFQDLIVWQKAHSAASGRNQN
jgi:hypothetical protein